MKHFLRVVPIILLPATLTASPKCWKRDPTVGGWSCEAVSLRPPGIGRALDEDKRDIAVISPDGLKKVRIRGIQLSLEMQGKEIRFPREIPEEDLVTWPSELGWSSDSEWFFITESGGSNLGGWHIRLFRVQDETVQRGPEVTEKIIRDFDRRHPCEPDGSVPNVAGVAWVDGSKNLLVAAEVYPVACFIAGYFEGYLISLPSGDIVARYKPQEVKKRWRKILGVRLSGDVKASEEYVREGAVKK